MSIKEKQVVYFENIYPYGHKLKYEFSNSLKILGYHSCYIGKNSDNADFFVPYQHHDNQSLFYPDPENFKKITYKDLLLWEFVCGNVGYELPDFLGKESKEAYSELGMIYTKAAYYRDFIEELISKHNPAAFVVWGGMFFESKIITFLAKKNGIPSYAIEYSFDVNRVYFDSSGVIGNRHSITNSWQGIRRKGGLSDQQLAWVKKWVDNNYEGKYATQPKEGVSDEALNFKSQNNKKIGLLLCQCFIDTVISMDSPIYRTTIEAYEAVINECASLDIPLVVKVHPGDREEYKKQIKQLCSSQKNVLYIGNDNNINVYSLMDFCDFGITINSQAGLEMLAKGKNVLTLGNAFYGDKGFNVQLKAREELKEKIAETSRRDGLQSSEMDLCYLFLYKLLRSYLIDISHPLQVTAKQIQKIMDGSDDEELLTGETDVPGNQAIAQLEDKLKIVIVHPSPRAGGSGYYIQDLAKSLIELGHEVLILSEGSCPPIDEGVPWRKIKFSGIWLDPELKELVRDFSPNVLLQVGVRTKPIRVALEIYLMSNPLLVMQAEDDEVLAFKKYYKKPELELLNMLDRPLIFSQDVVRFMRALDMSLTTEIWISPEKYRWVEPLMRILAHRLADQYCAIWKPMAERLNARFSKHVDLLPPIVDLSKLDMTPMDGAERGKILRSLGVDPESIVYFINGTVYDFSDEFEMFVDAIRLYKNVASKPIAILIAGSSRKDLSLLNDELDGTTVTCKVLGYLNDRSYVDLIKASDVICAPGKDDIFNRLRLSSRLVKGMLLGKPVFTFKTGFGESLKSGGQGFFTEIDTPYGWFHVLRQTEDSVKRETVGENGRQFALENFNAAIVADRLSQSWKLGLQKKRAVKRQSPGILEAVDLRKTLQMIYDKHVPMRDRLNSGFKIHTLKVQPYEFRPNIALLYGFSHSKKGRFDTVVDAIWVDKGISSFLVPADGISKNNVIIRMKHEEEVTDLDSDIRIYDLDGLIEHKRFVDGPDLVIDFITENSLFIVVKTAWREPKNNPSDKRRLYWMLQDIRFTSNMLQ